MFEYAAPKKMTPKATLLTRNSLSQTPHQMRRGEADMQQLRQIQAQLRGLCPTRDFQESSRYLRILWSTSIPGPADAATPDASPLSQ